MRFFVFLLIASALALSPASVKAQTESQPDDTIIEAPESGEDVAIERKSATSDSLLDDLSRQTTEASAKRIERQIWVKWNESGSATIDLLMERARESMRTEKNALADDLLTQVVLLAPDYAEGWNRRATLSYAMGDFGRSIGYIEMTLQLEPRHFGALSGLATILQRVGSDRKALETWYRVLAIYPANRNAQKQVIELEDKLSGRDA